MRTRSLFYRYQFVNIWFDTNSNNISKMLKFLFSFYLLCAYREKNLLTNVSTPKSDIMKPRRNTSV